MNHLNKDSAVPPVEIGSGSSTIPSVPRSVGFNTCVQRTNSALTPPNSACNLGSQMTSISLAADDPFSWSLLEPTPLREDIENSRKPAETPAWIQVVTEGSVHSKRNACFNGPETSTMSMNLKHRIAQSVLSSNALLGVMTPSIHSPAPLRENNLLHVACTKTSFCKPTIDQLLRTDPMCVKRRVVLKTTKLKLDRARKTRTPCIVREKYSLPLHLAIHHGAPTKLISMLVKAAPSILTMRDGPQNDLPMMILLKTFGGRRPNDEVTELIESMLRANPACYNTHADRHGNTPLHVAVARGVSSLDVIRVLSNPAALKHRNSHGLTPLELCQHRTCTCSEEVSNFLWEQTEAAFS